MTQPRYRGVRWREDTFEMRCDVCPSGGTRYWPLTPEFWNVVHGLSRCRACWLVYWRRREVEKRLADPELVRAYDRKRYRRNRRLILIKRAEYHERNRDYINAKARERYARRKAA